MMDKPLIKFSHCEKQIFCYFLPEACPVCDAKLSGRRLEEAPVSVPSPFTNGHKTTCCFLITPGNSDFDETSELHTGISDTKGVVYNYTMSGVRRDVCGWERSISIPLVRPDMFNLLDQWNQYLDKFSDGPMWDPAWHKFDEKEHNCYSFTLEFVNGVLAMQGKAALSKNHFTEKFILPRMKRASKYNMLSQQINSQSYYIIDRTAEEQGAQKT